MPWLTPDSIPEGGICRPLFIPDDTVWLALVSGALTELTQKWNWQKFGTLTVEETISEMQAIIDGYYSNECSTCELPDGGRIIRIGDGGKLQELSDGSWGDPTGDYIIPPPDARSGGTIQDQECLAAENAVNVIHLLYENLADSFASHLSEAEALTAFTLAVISLVGFEFAPITAAIVAFFAVAFTALYEALAYLTADLWDDAVSQQIECFLLACATNTDGVVTFDWDCFIGKLNSLTNNFLLSETQLRLYLQITYILYFIGGVDGLNLAGGTTAIIDAHCDECIVHCFYVDLRLTDGSEFGVIIVGGTWVDGLGVQGDDGGSNNRSDATLFWPFGSVIAAVTGSVFYTKTAGSGANNVNNLYALNPATAYNTTEIAIGTENALGTSLQKELSIENALAGLGSDINTGTNSTPCYAEGLMVTYTGDMPDGWSDNCP